jgi:hypothetical protein
LIALEIFVHNDINLLLPLSPEGIQIPRKPSELTEWIKQVRSAVFQDNEELSKAKRKQGLYKEFLDELTPLSEFCAERFNDSYQVLPVLGNQPFDAKVFHESGGETLLIELTMPYDGHEESRATELAANQGYSSPKPISPGEEVKCLRSWFKKAAKKKSEKNYSGCILVFVTRPDIAFDEVINEHIAEENKLADLLRC